MPDAEEWRPAYKFPGYEVSSFGAVRSVPRVTRHEHHRQGKVLSQQVDNYGYRTVTLQLEGRNPRPYRVHRLVADAFLGPRPAWADTRHGPGGRQDNRAVNLSYGTRTDNENDKKRDGTFNHGGSPCGETNQNAKLVEQDVIYIRQAYAQGTTQTALAEIYGVKQATVSQIVRGKTWRHLL